jgi:hypothetical protein
MPSPLLVCEGVSGDQPPPDPTGAVGEGRYIQLVNAPFGPEVAVYSKRSGGLIAKVRMVDLWKNAGPPYWCLVFGRNVCALPRTPCHEGQPGRTDPTITVDPKTRRWIMGDIAATDRVSPSWQCVAVSNTSDPVSGGWWLHPVRMDMDSDARPFYGDYTKMAIFGDSVYLTANMEPLGVARVFAFPRGVMQAGLPLPAVSFDLSTTKNVLPANDSFGSAPSGASELLVSKAVKCDDDAEDACGAEAGASQLYVWHIDPDWNDPSKSTIDASPTRVNLYSKVGTGDDLADQPLPPAGAQCTDFQPKPEEPPRCPIPARSGIAMQQVQYRNLDGAASLWVASAEPAPNGIHGIHWSQLDVTDGLIASRAVQSGLLSDLGMDGVDRFLPSLAVDADGNMAVGYNASSTTVYPSIRLAGRLSTDPFGALSQGERVLRAGGGTLTNNRRWGDYSAMTLDPVNPCDFWYVNEYVGATGSRWNTHISRFRYPTCGGSVDVGVTSPPQLRDSPFTVTFTNAVKGVDTAAGRAPPPLPGPPAESNFKVTPSNSDSIISGRVLCRDTLNAAVSCAKGPVKTIRFFPSAALDAGRRYEVSIGSGITRWRDGQSVAPRVTEVRAQTAFGPGEFPQRYSWGEVANENAFGGSYVEERYPNATASYTFTGTSFELWMWGGPDRGTATVTVTSANAPTITKRRINTYAATPGPIKFSWPQLAAGSHTVTVTTTGAKDDQSTDAWVGIDAVVVNDVRTETPRLAATWAQPTGYPYSFTGTKNATLTLTFYGTGFVWNALVGPNGGSATVKLDGTTVMNPDLYAPDFSYRDFPISGFPFGKHTLEITVLGTKVPASSDTVVTDHSLTVD